MFAVPPLKYLLESRHEVAAVVSQPDRPKGRNLKRTPPPVKVFAEQNGIPVFQPGNVSAPEFMEKLKSMAIDVAIVAAFGQIFKKELLNLPKKGCWNVHASLLPKYRGANPIERAIMNGERETGISIMKMDLGVDDGPVLSQKKVPIGGNETGGELEERLAAAGAALLMEALDQIEKGGAEPIPQDGHLASTAKKLKKEERVIDWHRSALEIHNLVRALNPSPGAFTYWRGERFKIWRTRPVEQSGKIPGELFYLAKNRIGVSTGKGGVELLEIQLPGKKAASSEAFLSGHQIQEGEILESGNPAD